MKERTFVSVFALLSSLGTYYYAKQYNKDTTPYVMIGGFLGALIGEIIFEQSKRNNSLSNKKSKQKKHVNRNQNFRNKHIH